MRKFWKVAFWIGSALVVLAAITLVTMWIRRSPTHDQALLKAINAESQMLLAKKFTTTTIYSQEANYDFGDGGSIGVAKSQWPPAIARLSPQYVRVDRRQGVDILIEGFFDGGWGYWVQPGVRKPPEPEGRFEYLGEDVYWYHPY